MNNETALFMVADDLEVNLNGMPSEETPEIVEGFKLVVHDSQEALPITGISRYPSEEEITFLINRHKFVKAKLLDRDDIIKIKGNEFVKKSGWRKFINAFGISIELIEKRVYEQFDDKHAEVRVRAIAPNGQSVEGIGAKSWSELYEKNMHNLVSTAWTRAVNRAVSDLVGYGAVSAEELSGSENARYPDEDDFESLPEEGPRY